MSIYSIIKTVGKTETNLVNQVIINDYQLPLDVVIGMDGKKIIANSQIVDGVEVFERVARKSYRFTFDFTLRGVTKQTTTFGVPLDRYVFPMQSLNPLWDSTKSNDIEDFFTKVWVPDQVVKIKNVLINSLGITELVVGEDIKITTIRGSVDVPVTLKAIENYYSINTQQLSLVQETEINFTF